MRIATALVLLAAGCNSAATPGYVGVVPTCSRPGEGTLADIEGDCRAQAGNDTRPLTPEQHIRWHVDASGACRVQEADSVVAGYSCSAEGWDAAGYGSPIHCVPVIGLDPSTGAPTSDACASLFARCGASSPGCASSWCCEFDGEDYRSARRF